MSINIYVSQYLCSQYQFIYLYILARITYQSIFVYLYILQGFLEAVFFWGGGLPKKFGYSPPQILPSKVPLFMQIMIFNSAPPPQKKKSTRFPPYSENLQEALFWDVLLISQHLCIFIDIGTYYLSVNHHCRNLEVQHSSIKFWQSDIIFTSNK